MPDELACFYRMRVRSWSDASDRLRPDRDRLIVARLSGIAQRRARWGAATRDEMTAGAAELRSSRATALTC